MCALLCKNQLARTPIQGGDLKAAFDRVVHGNLAYSKSAQKVLDELGDQKIVSCSVNRTPISISKAVALAEKVMPKFAKQRAKRGIDEFYHLYVLVTLDSGAEVAVEKNEIITITTGGTARKGAESIDVATPNATLAELMARTQAQMGDKFFPYSISSNNCQKFCLALLQSNGISSPTAKRFVKQNLKFLPSGAVSILNGIVQLAGHVATLVN
jgi:hypothetical protein